MSKAHTTGAHFPVIRQRTRAGLIVSICGLLVACFGSPSVFSASPMLQKAVKDELSPLVPPQPGESLESVQVQIRQNVDSVQTLTCTLELSKKRGRKPGRKIRTGPLEIARGLGARLALTQKGETTEYIANPEIIWAYDRKDKKAKYIPTDVPLISGFVQEALRLNVFMSVDEGTLDFLGSQTVGNEVCWVLRGESPRKLALAGVPPSKLRVWIAKSDGIPRRIRIPEGNDTMLVLRDVRVNVPIKPTRFQWTPPEGVKTRNIFGF